MNCEYPLVVRKILNQMSLCLMSYSYLLILSVIVLIIYNSMLAFIDFLQSIRQPCAMLSHSFSFNPPTLLLLFPFHSSLLHILQGTVQITVPLENLNDTPIYVMLLFLFGLIGSYSVF